MAETVARALAASTFRGAGASTRGFINFEGSSLRLAASNFFRREMEETFNHFVELEFFFCVLSIG